jgi:cupin fold WbuC family metalloprotein
MEKIYSKLDKNILLHTIHRLSDTGEKRIDLCPEEEYLQVSTFRLKEGKTFRPHRHITCEKTVDITQESWVIIRGKVKVFLYDIDKTLLTEKILTQGDCTITFRGGHNYLCLEDDTLVYECKTGPYYGQEKDKEFIDV